MFYEVNVDVRQSRRANNSVGIVKRAKERFCISESWRKRSRKPNGAIIDRVSERKQTLSVYMTSGAGS